MSIQVVQFSKTGPIGCAGSGLGEYEVFDTHAIHRLDSTKPFVLLGSPQSVNDAHISWIAAIHQVVARGIQYGTPILGICFGAQLLAYALGEKVGPVKQELGWHPVFDTEQQQERMVFQWHGEGFKLPANTHSLFLGEKDVCQGFSYKKIIATQFHFEVTEKETSTWSRMQEDRALEAQISLVTPLYLSAQQLLAEKLVRAWRADID